MCFAAAEKWMNVGSGEGQGAIEVLYSVIPPRDCDGHFAAPAEVGVVSKVGFAR